MTNPDLPPLHPGSRWDDDDVLDESGFRFGVMTWKGDPFIDCDGENIWVSDALALLIRAGLVPQVEELAESKAQLETANKRIEHLEEQRSKLRTQVLELDRKLAGR